MGVDYDSRLIIGAFIESDLVKKWLKLNNLENDTDDINKFLRTMPKNQKNDKENYVYMIRAGNSYNSSYEYYISFFDRNDLVTIGDIKSINETQLEIMRTIYSKITSYELEYESVDEVEVYSVIYIW